MMKLAILPLLFAQIIGTGSYRKVFSGGGGCTAPTAYETYEWRHFNATCSGTCSSGSAITLVSSSVGSNNLTPGTSPTYTPAAFGSLAAATYTATSGQYLSMASPFTASTNTSVWATIQPGTIVSSGALTIFGGTTGSFDWRLNGSYKQEVLSQGVASIAIGINNYTLGNKYTIGMTYNTSTGAYTFWSFSGGTFSVDTSGTATPTSFSATTSSIGRGFGSLEYFDGKILDIGYFNGTWNTTALNAIAAYSQCNAGV